jgi:hypothetical protein
MRAVLGALVRRFDMQLAPGFDPDEWLANLRDNFALTPGKLPIVLSERKRV